jgi:hypothetical protein
MNSFFLCYSFAADVPSTEEAHTRDGTGHVNRWRVTWTNHRSRIRIKVSIYFRSMHTRGKLMMLQILFFIVVNVVSCQAAINKMQFIKIPQQANTLPTESNIYLSDAEGVNFPDCAQQCSHSRDTCAGFFHNNHLKSCKILKSGKPGHLDYVNQDGWNFWRKGKLYSDVNFSMLSNRC